MNLHIQLHRRHEYGVAEVHRELGYGGAASVVSGSMSTGELVVEIALKVFPPNAETFRQEFAAMRALSHPFSHPYIIDFIGTSEIGAKDVIVLPLMSRGSLDKYLKDNPDADRARLILQVAEALRFMHDDAGFLHGDIKCQNVLVDRNGNAQLSDFGQTVTVRSIMSPGTEMPGGTLRFMAPELLVGEGHMTPASDVYAFGSLIYQAFANHMPWHNLTDSGAVCAICSGKSPPRSKAVPTFFWKLSNQCWRLEPDRRPRMRDIVPRIRSHMRVALPAWRIRIKAKDGYREWRLLDASVLSSLAKVAWGGWRSFPAGLRIGALCQLGAAIDRDHEQNLFKSGYPDFTAIRKRPQGFHGLDHHNHRRRPRATRRLPRTSTRSLHGAVYRRGGSVQLP